jgi:hypothetical protein
LRCIWFRCCIKSIGFKIEGENPLGLPGGFINKRENLDEAAGRIFKNRRTGENIYLNQFKTFGDLDRSEGFLKSTRISYGIDLSLSGFMRVDYSQVHLIIDDISDACEWKSIEELPEFMMDHRVIFDSALRTLRKQLNDKPIGYNLLPENSMPELQKII